MTAGFSLPELPHDVGYRLSKRRLIQCAVYRSQTSITAIISDRVSTTTLSTPAPMLFSDRLYLSHYFFFCWDRLTGSGES